MATTKKCWCGKKELVSFSSAYLRCPSCRTLIAKKAVPQEFYGKDYWFSYQEKELGCPNINKRARADLQERCLYWLRTILKYRTPPARALELGSAHGGFVALLNWAGYEARGLEIHPWVAHFARKTFAVETLLGPLESQNLRKKSLDIIVMMDVLEHLPDPVGTISCCLELLDRDGIMLIQTPQFPEDRDYESLREQKHEFLRLLQEEGHLQLFSRTAINKLFKHLGAQHIVFEPALFDQYDMFLIVSRRPLKTIARNKIDKQLYANPASRMVLALLDMKERLNSTGQLLQEAETDRNSRLQTISVLNNELQEVAAESNLRHAQIKKLIAQLKVSEKDRDARSEQIEKLTAQLKGSAAESAARYKQVEQLTKLLKESEADRTARMGQITELKKRVDAVEKESQDRIGQIEKLTAQLKGSAAESAARYKQVEQLTKLLKESEADRASRLQQIEQLNAWLKESDVDRTARFEQIEKLTALLQESEKDRTARFEQIEKLTERVKEVEAESNARLEQVEQLTVLLKKKDASQKRRWSA